MKINVKEKIIIILTIMVIALLILPSILTYFAGPHELMGVMIMLFFIVNPITTIVLNSIVGKDIKKLWWMPILFPIMFLLSYWLILKQIIVDLTFYAIIYLVFGIIFMIVSYFVSNLILKNKKE